MHRHVRDLLVSISAAFAVGSCLAQGAPASSTPSRGAVPTAEQLAWHKALLAHKLPRAGCFQAMFPTEEWTVRECQETPARVHKLPPMLTSRKPMISHAVGAGGTAGNGTNILANAVSGSFTSADGFFDPTVDVLYGNSVDLMTNATSDQAYSIQINTEFFATQACANAVTSASAPCRGWLQFYFLNDEARSRVIMEFWLLNFGATCPGEGTIPQVGGMPSGGSWFHDNNNTACGFDSPSVALPTQPINLLGKLRLHGEVNAGGNSQVSILLSDGTVQGYAIPDTFLQPAGHWTVAEFNVQGFNNLQQLQFNQGAALIAHLNLENGTTNAPILSVGGFTGESNNLNLVFPGCASSGAPSSMTFVEFNGKYKADASCPSKIVPLPVVPLTPCQAATRNVTIDQQALAKAQARLSDPLCQGPPSLECHQAVAAAQQALTSAIVRKNQACK
jgi:hypothetical protein